MAFNVGAILGTLELDDSKWRSAIDRAKADSKSFEGAVLRGEQGVHKLGVALVATGAALTVMASKTLDVAMKAQASERIFEVVLGRMAGSTRTWSEALSQALKVCEYDIRKTVSAFDVMLKGLNVNDDAALQMSKSLTKLSYDMASFYRISQEDAMEKLRSGIVGMTRPLRDIGIVINETQVQQWGLNNGIIKQGEIMSTSQQALARYALILQATKFAQGDLSKTLDSATNLSKQFGMRIEDISRTVGQALLPSYTKLLQLGNGVLEHIQRMMTICPQATSSVAVYAAAFGILATVAGTVLLALPGLSAAAAAAGTTMGAMALTMITRFSLWAAAITAVVWAFQNFDFITALFYSFSEGVNYSLAKAVQALSDFIDWLSKISPIAKKSLQDARDGMAGMAQGFRENADLMHQKAVESLAAQETKNNETQLKIQADVSTTGVKFNEMWNGAADAARHATDVMDTGFKKWFKDAVINFDYAREIGEQTFNAIADTISTTLYDAITGTFTSLKQAAANFGQLIMKMLIEMAAKWIAMKIMMGIGSLFSMGTAPALSSGWSASAGGSFSNTAPASMPSFDVGTDYVPHDMIAKIHKGEKITPASENTGEGGETKLTIYNLITPEEIARAMSGKEGQGVIVNAFETNYGRGGTVRRTIKRG